MLKIDIHSHIIPENLPDFCEKHHDERFFRLHHHKPGRARMLKGNRFFREIGANCWDPIRRIHECEQQGVAAQVISTIPAMFAYWAKPEQTLEVATFLNDHIAGIIQDHPRQFIGLATLPMQDPKLAVAELERCMGLGFAGVQIGTNIKRCDGPEWNLYDPQAHEVLAAAEQLGAAVFVHPCSMMGKYDMRKYWLPWLVGRPAEISRAVCAMIFSGVFEKFPKLRVCFAHGGGSFPGTIGRIEHGFECRPDLVACDNPNGPREYLGRFYVDAHVCDADAMRTILRLIGPEKIAMGSDYPFPLGEAEPGALIESMAGEIDATTTARLMHGTAFELLGLDQAAYLDAPAAADD